MMKDLRLTKTTTSVSKKFMGVTFEVGRVNNTAFLKKYLELQKEPGFDEVDGTCVAMAGTILLGWSGFFIDGETIEFNEDDAASLLVNDEEVREFISATANNVANFVARVDDEVVGKQ